MAILNGTDLLVYVDGTAFANTRDCTLNLNVAEIDVTSKDSSAWKDIIPGIRDWSIDFEGLVDWSDTQMLDDIFDDIDGKSSVTVKFSHETSGEVYFGGTAYFTNLTYTGPMEDAATYSGTLVGTGALSKYTKT